MYLNLYIERQIDTDKQREWDREGDKADFEIYSHHFKKDFLIDD